MTALVLGIWLLFWLTLQLPWPQLPRIVVLVLMIVVAVLFLMSGFGMLPPWHWRY